MSVAAIIRDVQFTPITAHDYVMLSPDGGAVKISAEMYQAIAAFMGSHRRHNAGEIGMQFRNGGCAGVELKVKLK